ncbi:MAG: hypothetical protein LPD71_10630 [Shewanella sp.]|nr:hypothetical protein [Shewanella sp.]MCF1439172.1 hypothetical protein [Shewanella sp.]MCF1456069.1 hypothetical protein [Shewanella sp.]
MNRSKSFREVVLTKALFSISLRMLLTAVPVTQASQEAVDSLAQGCYLIQSPANSQYMKWFYQGGLEDNGLSYRFEHTSPAEANRFYFKPSRRNHFMVTDGDGHYLASHLPAEVSCRLLSW